MPKLLADEICVKNLRWSFLWKQLLDEIRVKHLRCRLYKKNHATQVRRLTWVRSQQNGVFHFVKANGLYENGFIPPSWDLTSTQVRSHLGGMFFLHVNSFYQAVPPRQDCSFSLDSAYFYNCYVKKCNSS